MSIAGVVHRLAGNRAVVWLAAVAGGVAIHLVLWQISDPESIFSDFFKAYFQAADRVWRIGPVPTWTTEERSVVGFVNLPILAWLFVPIARFDGEIAAWYFLYAGIAATAAAWALLCWLAKPDAKVAAPLLFLFLVNGPLVNSLREGNTTHFILFLLIVALLLWRARWEFTAGLVLGLCGLFKLPLLLFGPYFLLRRRWRIVAGGATSVVVAVLLSLGYFGLKINIGWLECCVTPFIRGVMPAFNVQSIDGFLMRLELGEFQLLNWTPIVPSVTHRIARTILLAAMFGGFFWLIWRAERKEPQPAVTGALSGRDLLEFSMVINLVIMTSPVSWSHYYLFLLLPLGFYLGRLLPLPEDATTRWLIWTGFVLTSLPVTLPDFEPGFRAEVIARTIVSSCLFGGFLMFAALARGAWRLGQAPAPALAAAERTT
jgi:hypothetical protein